MSSNEILVLAAGGTILKQQQGQKMEWSVNPEELIKLADKDVGFELETVHQGLAANFTMEKVVAIAQLIRRKKQQNILITLGTDILEEVAFSLAYLLGSAKTVVITASMRPYGREGYEGISNLRDAFSFLKASNSHKGGVFVVINEQIFLGKNVFKYHSSRIDAFRAYPEAVGEFLSGQPFTSHVCEKSIPIEDLETIDKLIVSEVNVPILWTHMNMDPGIFDTSKCDGLVIAAMGAGSAPEHVTEFYADNLTKDIPIVISTRCPVGPNHAESMYTGAVEKYTNRGFLVREFTGLNALQVRSKMHIDIALHKQGIKKIAWLSI